ncbi:MAG: PfkB family carbohydrate kinase [Terracidiphilus sp.]
MPHALFVGLPTIDIVYRVDRFPEANSKIAAQSQSVYAGGPATNAAIACAHLGAQSALVTAVGRHPIAALIREELASHSIQLIDLAPSFDGVPAISSVTVDKAGNRNVVSANAAGISVPSTQVDVELCRQARILMVDGHHMQACHA